MTSDLDHLFIFVDPAAPAIAALAQFGLAETYRRRHPGQGTENVCYRLDNAYLELLWVNDPAEIDGALVAPTGLGPRSRWRTAGTCPFGIALRHDADPPFATWPYRPPYLPPQIPEIAMAADSADARGPLFFVSPGGAAAGQDFQPRLGWRRITGLALAGPHPGPALPGLAWSVAPAWHATAEIDGGISGRQHDFGPALPLTLRW